MNRKIKKVTFNIIIVAALLCGFAWVVSRFVHLGRVEYTDNAQVRQHIVPVNSRVQGFIKEIRFEEYRHVRKGDTLAIIEDAEYRLRVAQAEADLQNARVGKTAMNTSISTISNNLEVSDAGIAEVEVLMRNAGKDYERYQKLVEQKAVTRREYDQVKANYESLKAKYDMLTRQKRSTALTRDEQSQRLAQTEAGIRLAEAALELARLNLSYTVVVAPCDGVTSRKAVQEGQLVQPGQTLLTRVDDSEIWVLANYKETQTAHIAEGMPVDITVDAVPGVVYRGRVEALSRATGAQYFLVPQDNSAGNFVKVEQRVPVKIAFTGDNSPETLAKLRAGLNVECEVKY